KPARARRRPSSRSAGFRRRAASPTSSSTSCACSLLQACPQGDEPRIALEGAERFRVERGLLPGAEVALLLRFREPRDRAVPVSASRRALRQLERDEAEVRAPSLAVQVV